MNIGRNIHDLRVARKLPLDKLLRLCGLGVGRIDRLEMGKGYVEFYHVARLALALRVDVSVLLGD